MAVTETPPEFRKIIPWKLALTFLLFSTAIILIGIFYFELLSPQKKYFILIALVIILLILINALIFGFWIWQQRITFYRNQLNSEVSVREMEERFTTAFRMSPVDEQLKVSEELFRKLFENMLNGFAYCKMLYEDGQPVDFLYLNVNEAFESLTGLKDVVGKRASEAIPGIREADPGLIERYGKVASTGSPEVFETFVESLEMWFAISVYSPQKEYFVAVFDVITARKIAEEKLHESEEKFRKVFLTNPDSITITRLDNGTYVSVNDGFTRTFGYSEEEVLGKTSFDISIWVNPDDRKQFIKSLQTYGKVRNFETEFYSKSKKVIGCLLSATTINLEGIDHVLSNVKDVSERKLMDEALRDSEDKFKYVFDYSPIAKSITFPTGEIHVNKAFCEMLGYTKEELEKTKLQEISHPDDIEITQSYLNILLTGEKDSVRFVKRYFHKNGEIIWADVGTSLRHDQKNNPLYFVTAITDITERKRAEDALRESEERFRSLANSIPQLAWVAHADGFIYWYNKRWYDYTGTTPEQMEGWGWQMVHDPLVLPDVMENWTKSIASGLSFEMTFPLRAADGSFRNFLTRVHPWKDPEGKVIQWFGTNTDVEALKQTEEIINKLNEELEQKVIQRTELLESANKELEAFSYSVSHDLRAPLRSVHGFTKILLEDYETLLDDEGKRICGIISSSATQMGELIDDLLSFSRIGRSSLNPTEIDMKKMAVAIFEGMASPIERKRIKLTFGQMDMAFGDVALFGQVWTNLISNAIKYTSKNVISEINIGSKVDEGMITYFIKDNGVGFEMKYAHKLFGVFQRLHSEAEFEGNGVGLAIIQRIILKHGGKVWAEGEVGKGAAFYFSLPIHDINIKTHDT